MGVVYFDLWWDKWVGQTFYEFSRGKDPKNGHCKFRHFRATAATDRPAILHPTWSVGRSVGQLVTYILHGWSVGHMVGHLHPT